ncbi:hypothetical protein K435DRAFT_620517, partial [Dendrothele bispora CBS 962.96]
SFKAYVCKDCLTPLSKGRMPPLALANQLYRGELPEELEKLNITWAEEMACALYHMTAHVIRLYGSTDESQPRILHGNTCAHELNTVSTARVLPWTPADLNGFISVVFVGPRKLSLSDLQKLNQHYVRKKVVWKLLCFLFNHNILYISMKPPDHKLLDLYPENGILPGLPDR